MNRPTCKTCPYFEVSEIVSNQGKCQRNTPRRGANFILEAEFWCGEHPDFEAFIRAKKEADKKGASVESVEFDKILSSILLQNDGLKEMAQIFKSKTYDEKERMFQTIKRVAENDLYLKTLLQVENYW
jgi:hypothetical protein